MLLNKNPRIVWRWSMLCLLAFFTTTFVERSAPPAWEDLLDGTRGALLGATLALMAVFGVIKRRRIAG